MPMKGIICPIDGERVLTHDCLACRVAEKPRPKQGVWCEYPYEILSGMYDNSGRKTAYISATMLGGCRRQARLKETKDYYTYPMKMFPAFRGTIGHKATESHPQPGCLYEHRFEVRLPGFPLPFTGAIDKINIMQRKISDFKTKAEGKLPDSPAHEHVMQLNVYRYLVKYGWPQTPFNITLPNDEYWTFPLGTPAEIEIDQLELIYWNMAGIRTFSTDSGTDALPIYPEDAVLEYITEGMKELTAPELPDIPDGYNPLGGNPLCHSWCPVKDDCIDAMYAFNPGKLRDVIDDYE